MKQYVVDAFTDKVFSGNPAAVCVLDHRLNKDLMQAIAKENNLSETAFALKIKEGHYHLRWFTPKEEIGKSKGKEGGKTYVRLDESLWKRTPFLSTLPIPKYKSF